MRIKSTLLAVTIALVLILALGVACEGEDVTREDFEKALEEALGTDVDMEEVEQAARDALADGTEDVATGSTTPFTRLQLEARSQRCRRSSTRALKSTPEMRMDGPLFLMRRRRMTNLPLHWRYWTRAPISKRETRLFLARHRYAGR